MPPSTPKRWHVPNPVSGLLGNLWASSVELNARNIERLGREASNGRTGLTFCDLGCGDALLTERIARAVGAGRVAVVETYDPHVGAAESRGFEVTRDDLNGALSLASTSFDIVLANQVIEHLYDTEQFLAEATRILRPGGTLIVSTENPASWHNIAALALGWQPFSLANVSSRKTGIGNPFSLAPQQEGWPFPMQHHRLFTPKALRELFALEGLENVRCLGAGYYPLPGRIGLVDPTHAAFITLSGRRSA
jgi:SAM-dependent methyltransferase